MTNTLTPKWIKHFYTRAKENAKLSKLPVKCGAVLVDPIRKISVGDGHNGFSKHINDTSERLTKPGYWRALGIHAEVNCILHTKEHDLRDFILFVTRFPCASCASIISQVGIKTIYSPSIDNNQERFKHRQSIGNLIFFESGINWVDIEEVRGKD